MDSKDRQISLPFAVDRASRTDLPRQVTDGLRAAIKTGFFKSGDILPSVQELRKALGVSVRAPLEAIRCLADEGLVASRRHVGCVVLGRHEMSWKGHVLIIYPNITPVFYKSVIEMRVSDMLQRNGYLATRLMLGGGEKEGYDFSQLDLLLKQPTSFVLVLGDRPKIFRRLASAGVPYVGFMNTQRTTVGSVGYIHYDCHAADGELAECCLKRGVKTLVQVGAHKSLDFMDKAMFKRFGIRLETQKIVYRRNVEEGVGALVRASYKAFDGWKPEGEDRALFFIDDYIARGAMTAMIENGIRIGEDVLIGAHSNRGIDLVFGKDITRIEARPRTDAEKTFGAIHSYLNSGVFPEGVNAAPVFVQGETL